MNGKRRDRPRVWDRMKQRFVRFTNLWGADVLLVLGSGAITVGAALIYPPAGWIAGGVLTIAGGVLAAIGGGES